MQHSLSNLVNNLSGIDNKELKELKDKILQIDKKKLENKLSQIDQKVSQIDKKELKNKFADSMRSKMVSLKQSINKI